LAPAPPVYRASTIGPGSSLRQGEFLSNVIQFRLDVTTLGTPGISGRPHVHPYAMILTQDCDLDQDFRARAQQAAADKIIPNVLFCEVATAEELRGSPGVNSSIWARIRTNKDERYHFLQKVEAANDAAGQGLPELGIDFKRYFTLQTDEVYRRIELGEALRRCVLVSPYLEHLGSRFAYYLRRIALPQEHLSEPG
jgi:hypothetical protein